MMEFFLAGLVLILIALAESFRRERNELRRSVDVIALDLAVYGTCLLRRNAVTGRVERVDPTLVQYEFAEDIDPRTPSNV